VDIRVDVGDEVEQGQGVAVFEAMKMEQEIVSRYNGIVNSVPIRAGSAIRKGDVICWLESATD
jgi:biotin carboxyl carrier protein